MIQKIILLVIVSSLFISCNSSKSQEDSNKIGKVEYPSEINTFLELFSDLDSDFKIDAKFIEDSTRNISKNKLTLEQVKLLSQKLSKDEMTEINDYYLKDYFTIEKAKENKTYDKYVEKLDLGMMKDANCFALGKIELGDSVSLLIWKMEFTSYEACPVYYGTNFLATVISGKTVIQTLQIACQENAADAPMASEITQDFSISKKGIVKIKSETNVFEEDVRTEHTNSDNTFVVSKKGFVKK
ncbi:MAG: hypothetical protein ACK5B9_11265 [Flavobacteriia bacterium]|jgi:predicted transcriptional regulator